jgi:preprotein translocase subunit YajC
MEQATQNQIQLIIPPKILEKIRDGLYVITLGGIQTAVDDVHLRQLYKEIKRVYEPSCYDT